MSSQQRTDDLGRPVGQPGPASPSRPSANWSAPRVAVLTRAGWGLTLLLTPRLVLRVLHGRVDAPALVVARLLGMRHLLQAGVTAWRPSRPTYLAGAAVDTAHALSTLGLALADRQRRVPALVDTMLAAAWTAVGVWSGPVQDRSAKRRVPAVGR
ncbi:hypothetical protein ABNF97_31210 [Plantactinospora sp. B6F1]|uniref:hypothetical protein n=1 Tax=Plantactinospora sp. B6F1 TaxID=3158971 RepID=UPI0032D8FE95